MTQANLDVLKRIIKDRGDCDNGGTKSVCDGEKCPFYNGNAKPCAYECTCIDDEDTLQKAKTMLATEIANYYSRETEYNKLAEEFQKVMGELDLYRAGKGNKKNFTFELADLKNVIEHLAIQYEVPSEDVDEAQTFKRIRECQRIIDRKVVIAKMETTTKESEK